MVPGKTARRAGRCGTPGGEEWGGLQRGGNRTYHRGSPFTPPCCCAMSVTGAPVGGGTCTPLHDHLVHRSAGLVTLTLIEVDMLLGT